MRKKKGQDREGDAPACPRSAFDKRKAPEPDRLPDGIEIFPIGVFGSLPDINGEDPKQLIGREMDDLLSIAASKLEFLRSRVGGEQLHALQLEYDEFRRKLESLKASGFLHGIHHAPHNGAPYIHPELRTTYIHNGRVVNIGILTPEHFEPGQSPLQISSFINAYSLVERYNSLNSQNARIISPHLADAMLAHDANWPDNSAWRFFQDNNLYPVLTNAFIAYEAPGVELGQEIVFREESPYLAIETGRYAGMRGVALFISDIKSKDFRRHNNGSLILDVPETRITLVEGFPSEHGYHGYYALDPATTIPIGDKIERSESTRVLWRTEGNYVGPIFRRSSRICIDVEMTHEQGCYVIVEY